MLFMYRQNDALIQGIEILSSNVLMYRHGEEISCFIGARIITGIMRCIAKGVVMRPDAPDTNIGRGHVTVLNEVFYVNLPTAARKTKLVLEFV
jgi:hypothetical protein